MHLATDSTPNTPNDSRPTETRRGAVRRPTANSTGTNHRWSGFTVATDLTRRWTVGRSSVSIERWTTSESPILCSPECSTIISCGRRPLRCRHTRRTRLTFRMGCVCLTGHGTACKPNEGSNVSWPGNIRELQNILERATVLAQGSVIEHRFRNPACRCIARRNTSDARFFCPCLRICPYVTSTTTQTFRRCCEPFIRAILGEASWLLGGLTDEEWQRTMDYFGGRCAYTDEPLVVGEIDQDHVVPMNMKECGLHLFGNVLPVIKEANAAKHARPYVDFVRDPQRRSKIDTFVRESGYNHRARSLGDLRDYCRSQYELINSLFGEAKSYLHELAPGNSNGPTRTPRRMGVEICPAQPSSPATVC